MIKFKVTLRAIGTSVIIRLPKSVSKQLPSRGQVAVRGTINGHDFEKVLEPDGDFGHWLKLDDTLQKILNVSVGDTVTLAVEPTRTWPEPTIPADFAKALASAPASIRSIWKDITPMARWEWIRWVHATNNDETRKRRVEVSIAKMESGKRRPCCFNLASCTDPDVSRSGKLMTDDAL